MRIHSFIVLSFLVSLFADIRAFSQAKVASIKISNVRAAYIDRPGDLYVLQADDTISKFDVRGKITEKMFFQGGTNFDPRDGSRVFIYFKASQHFAFLAKMEGISHPIRQEYAIEPIMACAAGDNQAWILDRADWSIKRIDPVQAKIVADELIEQKQFYGTPEFIFMREYQQFLFLIEKSKGIIIFNNLGHQIKKIVDPDITTLNFLGEELYYKKGDKLLFYDFFDGSTREMPIDPTCKFALLSDVRRFLVYDDRIEIFENQ